MTPGDAIGRMVRPRSVAIVGASPTPGSLGASVLANLQRSGFTGAVHLVNPRRAEINGQPCVPSPAALPHGVDVAVLAIPGAGVLDALRECAAAGVGSAIIFSAGFAEEGPDGMARQEEVARIAREAGMAVEGPNCLGLVNGVDGVALTFVDTAIPRFPGGRGVAVVSQSGAMAAVVNVGFTARGLPLAFSVSTGNEAVLGAEDFLRHVLEDEHVAVVAMVAEKFRQPRRFLDLARAARARGKHIVLLHPGRSAAARLSAQTHTGALAGDDAVMRLLVRNAGVTLVERLEQLLDVTELLLRCPAPANPALAVLTESGAFKALTLDLCEELGLPLPAPENATARALQEGMPPFIPPSNPMDLTAQALVDPDLYRRAMAPLLADPAYGSVLLGIILTNEATSRLKMPAILAALRALEPTKPVLFAALDEGAAVPPEYVDELRALGVPFFPSPERAFTALSLFAALPAPGPAHAEPATVRPALPPGVLPEHRSKAVVADAGVPVPRAELATDVEAAQDLAEQLGFPVVLKAQSAGLSHKSDAGGVVLNLRDRDAVRAGWDRMHADLARHAPGLVLDGVLVEAMAPPGGTELIVGARRDPDWGPVVLVGLGGIWAEALHDTRLLPPGLSRAEAESELLRLKGAALLRGFRGSPALDTKAAAEVVCRVAQLMAQRPEIAEMDLNPVVVYPDGALALDAVISVGTPA